MTASTPLIRNTSTHLKRAPHLNDNIYRPELDGLRALALLSVMAYHADLGLPNGFLGVDIFFVLSGYLITRRLLRSLREGPLDIKEFYLNRARRLLPMLFVVMSVSALFGYLWMTPAQLRDLSQSFLAASLSLSNLLFWHESGYFQPDSAIKPLLHTWSLAIEEQFYLALPLLLWIIWRGDRQRGYRDQEVVFSRRRRRALMVCIVVWGISLATCEWSWRYAPSFNYYSPFTRAWELLTGVVVALWRADSSVDQRSKMTNPVVSALLSVVGLSAILLSILASPHLAPHPSVYTLIPVLGVALTIHCTRVDHSVSRLLSRPILVWLGLISYSAYLWHQPLLALARIDRYGIPLELSHRVGLIGFALLLAALCKRFIEDPIRFSLLLKERPRLTIIYSMSGVALFSLLGIFGHLSGGLPQRGDPSVYLVEKAGTPTVVPCSYHQFYRCQLGDQSINPQVALVGDSHAGMYSALFDRRFRDHQAAVMYAGDGWCAPLLDFITDDRSKNGPRCAKEMSSALRAIAQNTNIHTVILAAEWSHYLWGERPGQTPSLHQRSVYRFTGRELEGSQPILSLEATSALNAIAFKRSLEATISLYTATGKSVIIIEPVPELSYHVPQALASSAFRRLPPPPMISKLEYQAQNQAFFMILNELTSLDFERWSVAESLCDVERGQSRCRLHDENSLPLYSDSNHLTERGATIAIESYLKIYLQ